MNIKVMDERSTPAWSEADYVRVHVSPDPGQDTMTLATIERVVCKSDTSLTQARRVKKLIERRPMTLDAAVVFARLYAARKGIEFVVTAKEPEAP